MTRQDILDNIGTRLQGITQENGYNTDAGFNVAEWQVTAVSEGADFAIQYGDIKDKTETVAMGIGRGGYHDHTLTVQARGIVQTQDSTITDIRKLIADIYKAIGVDPTWNAKAIRTENYSDLIEVHKQSQKIAGCLFQFDVIYRTAAWTP